jgi:hypothetical protein
VRSIDQNIRREQPTYSNFYRQSKRLLIFKDLIEPLLSTTRIEEEYTRGMTYSGWHSAYDKAIDGCQTHGWDWAEVAFDESKPLHVNIEHIGFEKLIFPRDAVDIQACQMIFRAYSVSPRQLKKFITKYNFNPNEVQKLIDKQKAANVTEKNIEIYKKFCKYNDVVYVAWFNLECEDWLLAPIPLYLGRQVLLSQTVQVPTPMMTLNPLTGQPEQQLIMQDQLQQKWVDVEERMYPVFRLPYFETEQAKLTDVVGRVFLDKHKQEAKTANLSQFINQSQNASSVFSCLDTDSVRNESEIQNISLDNSRIIPLKIKFFSPPSPDATMLMLQNYLDAFDSQEAGRMDFAAMNRKDSRKTATEVNAAQQESSVLGSMSISLLSKWIREIHSFSWEIVKSQALQGKITFLADPETQENNEELLNRPYEIRAAGDIDVVKRLELVAQYKEFWPVIQNTHIAVPFLSRLLKLALSEDGEYFATLLQQTDPRIILSQLVAILESTLQPQDLMGLTPEQQQTFMQVMTTAKQISEDYIASMQPGSPDENSGENNNNKQPKAQNEPSPAPAIG